MLKFPTVSALCAASPWAAEALPLATQSVREAVGSDLATVGDEGVDASQHAMAQARIAAASAIASDLVAADLPAAAALRSAAGPGAAGWARLPSEASLRLRDAQFRIAARVRLHLDLPMCSAAGTCRHLRPDGTLCGAALDPKGFHARCCPVGGWLVKRHNAGCAALAEWAETECGCVVYQEQQVPTANPHHAEARLDIVLESPRAAGSIYVDFTVVSALSVEALARGLALRDGVAADLAATKKEQRYPHCRAWAFPVEDHGRFGEDALALGRALAPAEPERRSRALARLQQAVSAAVQRVAADSVIDATTAR